MLNPHERSISIALIDDEGRTIDSSIVNFDWPLSAAAFGIGIVVGLVLAATPLGFGLTRIEDWMGA